MVQAKALQGPLSFIHPKLQAAVDQFAAGVRLSFHRALTQHQENPSARSAMPADGNSLEQVFARYLSLPHVAGTVRTAAKAASPPVPAGVNPADPAPVLDQIIRHQRKVRFNLTRQDVEDLARSRRLVAHQGNELDLGQAASSPVDLSTLSVVQLRIHRVKCLDETREVGDDEIALGGFLINDQGEVINVAEFYVSKSFSTGETRTYSPPRVFGSFIAMRDGQKKVVLATLVLAEKDQGGFSSILKELWSRVLAQATIFAAALLLVIEELVPDWVQTAIGAVWPLFPAILQGLLIGALVGAVVTVVVVLLASMLKDDVFDPVSTGLYIQNINEAVTTPRSVALFSGHGGRYEVVYDWTVIQPPAPADQQAVPKQLPAAGTVRTYTEAAAVKIVERLYRALLGRAVDPAGSATWTPQVRNGGLLQVASGLATSSEFERRRPGLTVDGLARAFYRAILDRDVDRIGLETTAAAIRAGNAARRIADMVLSAEYQQRNPS